MADRIATKVSRIISGLSATGPYLHMSNPEFFLRGFALDMPPGSCYVIKYCLPLYADIDFLHLSFGYRLNDGYVSTSGRTESEIANSIADVIRGHMDFAPQESIEDILGIARLVDAGTRAEILDLVSIFDASDKAALRQKAASNRAKFAIRSEHQVD